METSPKEVIIVTGSSGLIGSRIINRLTRNYRVVGLDKAANPFPSEKAECIAFDIKSEESIRKAMGRVKYAYGDSIASVIHLAAYYDFSGEPSPLYEAVTVKGTENFLHVLQDFNVEQFVFSSTNLVYKPTIPGQKIDENCPLEPNWDYPESKADTEDIIRNCRGNIHAVSLRLAGVYDEDGHSIPIAHQLQRIYEKQLISHFYSGEITHGNVFLHMDDLLEALEKTVVRRKELPPEVAINIGEPVTLSYEALQNQMGKLIHGKEWTTFEMPESVAKAGAWAMNLFGDPFIKPWMIDRTNDHYEFDITRAKELLGWEPQHTLADTLPGMIQKLKSDPIKWYKANKLEPPSALEKQAREEEKVS